VTAIVSTSPQRPEDVVGEWPDAGAAGVESAIERARLLGAAARRDAPDVAAVALRLGRPVRDGLASLAVPAERYWAERSALPWS